MGKKLIIKGADFSENGIGNYLDITELIDGSGKFYPDRAITVGFEKVNPDENPSRCTLIRLSIGTLVSELTRYSKLRIDIKPGFDYVLGIARDETNLNDAASWSGLSGEGYVSYFDWISLNQYVETPVSETMIFTGNFRYDDNTTQFDANTKFSDIATIKLIE